MNLEDNDLTTIPGCLLLLPKLVSLNLSNNSLTMIPDVGKLSPRLKDLDLSSNQLSDLPDNISSQAMCKLNLGRNQFSKVPSCICSMKTLCSLTLSHNPKLKVLPPEMGKLVHIEILQLDGLSLKDPPKHLLGVCHDCIQYLKNKLHDNYRSFYQMKLMLIGDANRGKTTLVEHLLGKEHKDESAIGVKVNDWLYRPSLGKKLFHFKVWDFSSQRDYDSYHQCFLTHHTLYLLLFNLKHGDKGVEELRPWLNSLEVRAPQSCVMIVGTHLDEVLDEEREEIDALLERVSALANPYRSKLHVVEVFPVGLRNRIENIGLLKEAIYSHAANYKNQAGQLIMGQKVPEGYHALVNQVATIQLEVMKGIRQPIMHAEELKMIVHQMNLTDMDDEELKIATTFLTEVGSLLYYDDCSHNLHEIYFVDPCWLYKMISKIITTKDFIKNGILYFKDVPKLFNENEYQVLQQYFEQFLTLLDKFEIVLPLDNQRALVPSALPGEKPQYLNKKPESIELVYSRLIFFNTNLIPSGVWSRLLSRIMYFIPRVINVLHKLPVDSEQNVSTVAITSPHDESEMSLSIPVVSSNEMKTTTTSSQIPATVGARSISPLSSFAYLPSPRLERFPELSCFNLPHHLDGKDIHFELWCRGLYYKDSELMFKISSTLESIEFNEEANEGIIVAASANSAGRNIFCQLIDLVVTLTGEWYPYLLDHKFTFCGLEQKSLCFECMKEGRKKPFEINLKHCLVAIKYENAKSDTKYNWLLS